MLTDGVDKMADLIIGWRAIISGVLMKIDFITQEQADNIKRRMPKTKVMLESENYLKQLTDGKVGKIEIAKDDVKPYTVRNRLVKASKNLEMRIEIKRINNVILFWKVSNDV